MTLDLWPSQATFGPDQPVGLIATATEDQSAVLTITHLDATVSQRKVDLISGRNVLDVTALPHGGYGVTLCDEQTTAVTAFDVLPSPMQRPRYGFLSEFTRDRDDLDSTIDGLLQLHLNVVQFYDWMYRHADLVADTEEFIDTLGRPLSHRVARRLAAAVTGIGGQPLGYAAVYGAAKDYAEAHPDQILYRRPGQPWMLEDFLWIMNPSPDNPWQAHIISQFQHAVDAMGFAGLHLDQYGAPKTAVDHHANPVDLAVVFPQLIAAARDALPDATLVFNNVNNYPTWATVNTPQDAIYIEVWPPHDTYCDLADLIRDAHAHAPDKPVILAAYLTPFATEDPARAEWAARLALATVFSHGGHYLLCGEGNAVLTDPYYPNFARVPADSHAVLRRSFDHAVALGDLLYDPAFVDITDTHYGGINDDITVTADQPVYGTSRPGAGWLRAVTNGQSTVVHLIDLTAQHEIAWNSGKEPSPPAAPIEIRVRTPDPQTRAWWATPDDGPRFHPLDVTYDGEYLTLTTKPYNAWATILLKAGTRTPSFGSRPPGPGETT